MTCRRKDVCAGARALGAMTCRRKDVCAGARGWYRGECAGSCGFATGAAFRFVLPQEYGLPRQCAHWLAMPCRRKDVCAGARTRRAMTCRRKDVCAGARTRFTMTGRKRAGVGGARRQKSGSPPRGTSGSCYTSRLPAGMLPSSITKCSCSPRSADRSIPQLSCPIIFRGARLVTATRVLPTSSSGV